MIMDRIWYQKHRLRYALLPLAWSYRSIVAGRRALFRVGLKKTTQFSVPVIVVGNITVGGTGKTPFVIWLVDWLKTKGYRPGVVSRGYGGHAKHYPQAVVADSDPREVGDEAVIIARKTNCPMYIGPKRVAAVSELLAHHNCNIVISDDGLQHYALGRDIEIALIDHNRQLGNRLCLPAGPLREPPSRLNQVDFILYHGGESDHEFSMRLVVDNIYNLSDPNIKLDLENARQKTFHAVAGIGHPERFFNELRELNFNIIPHPFPDHHRYTPEDLNFKTQAPIIMTEKDAVKCQAFAKPDYWSVSVAAEVSDSLKVELCDRLHTHLYSGNGKCEAK